MYTLAFTGHRGDKLGDCWLPSARTDVVLQLANHLDHRCLISGPLTVISGMALGWDMLVARAAIHARGNGAPITVVAAIPFWGQEQRWPYASKQTYYDLLAGCDTQEIISDGGYSAEAMQLRNEWMVNRSDKLVACWNGSPGGTANCIAYARRIKHPWTNVLDRYFPELLED